MKNTAIIISVVLIGMVGWFIFMPHASAPKPVVEPTVATTTQPSTEPVATSTPPATKPIIKPVTTPTPKPQPTPTPTPTPVDATTYYTRAEVSAHASTQSCWSIVNGKVYDLTSWISQHPGGSSAIKRMCGVDGSANFNGQHGGQSRPERELASFFIGVLR